MTIATTNSNPANKAANDANLESPDSDLPGGKVLYHIELPYPYRYSADLTPPNFLSAIFKSIPISDYAHLQTAATMKWGDWAEILSSLGSKSFSFIHQE